MTFMSQREIVVDRETLRMAGQTTFTSFAARYGSATIVLLALLASVAGLRNGFAFDDVHVILDNSRVHDIANAWRLFGQSYWPPEEGASLYRPLLMFAFAVEWAVGRGSALPFHIVNVSVYMASCVALYRLLLLVVAEDVALIAAALFAVHPAHVEAVANIVGQGELWVALLMFLALAKYIRVRRKGVPTISDVAALTAMYLTSLMFKEHAIVLPAVLFAADIFLLRKSTTMKERLREIGPLFVSFIVAATLFVIVRTVTVGGFSAGGSNELFRDQPYHARIMTMLTIVVEWLRLFFWPADLSADYSFPRTRIWTRITFAMLPGILVIAGCAVLGWRLRRTHPEVTFGLVWIAIALIIPSNLVVMTGFVLAERTLFVASAGVMMLASLGGFYVWRRTEQSVSAVRAALFGTLLFLLVGGIVRSATRAPVWRNNESLFAQTVEDVPGSSRAHLRLAVQLSQDHGARAGLEEMSLAVALGRKDDAELLGLAADQLSVSGLCPRAVSLYLRALALTPRNVQLRVNTSLCLMNIGRIDEGRTVAEAGLASAAPDARLVRTVKLADSLAAGRIVQRNVHATTPANRAR